MTDSKLLSRIKKLLNLANAPSATEGEAANAASLAQALMTRYQIDEIALEMADAPEPEVIRAWDDPLDQGKRYAHWKGRLSMSIAKVNACKIYKIGGSLMIIGEQRDAQSVRYLYAYLVREINHLAKQYGGNGRTWINNWRLGVVETIGKRLKEAHDEAIQQTYAEASSNGTALVVVDNALAVVEQRRTEVERIARDDLRLTKGNGSSSRYNSDARSQGRRDGAKINLNTGARIGGGQKRIGG